MKARDGSSRLLDSGIGQGLGEARLENRPGEPWLPSLASSYNSTLNRPLVRGGRGHTRIGQFMAELVSEADGPIHRLTLNIPARRNAITPSHARSLAQE